MGGVWRPRSVRSDPDAKNLLRAVRQNIERDVDRLIAHEARSHEAFVADLAVAVIGLAPDAVGVHMQARCSRSARESAFFSSSQAT